MSGAVTETWVTRELGIELLASGTNSGYTVKQLVQPGLRRNPRRAHLLVSTVLGKHLPVHPAAVLAAADELGDRVATALGESAEHAVVLGFAETATGLGHCVAARIRAKFYLHSTRRAVPGVDVWARFEEGHSHATNHMLLPIGAHGVGGDSPLVLVDDEFSTGATALGAIRALAALQPRRRYVVASLVDLRTPSHHADAAAVAAELNIRIDSVALAAGQVVLPPGVIERVCALPDPEFNPRAVRAGSTNHVDLPWPSTVPDGGRHGFFLSDTDPFDEAVGHAALELGARLDRDRPVIVIGHEELMYLPLRLGGALADGGFRVAFQTTTRSPAHVLDQPGYPLRRGFRFTAPELGEESNRYLYNAQWADSTETAQLVLVVDPPANTPRLRGAEGLVDLLSAAGHDVLVAALPGVQTELRDSTRGFR